MRMYDVIMKKREGGELSTEEINFFIQGYTKADIPDYQVSALMMAIYFRGMNKRETADLTMAMVNSGQVMELASIEGKKVDKHSTGGVGDKTSLVLAAMVAAAGVPVAKMSGRGLGHTGGTIDKLESFPGFTVTMTPEQFLDNVRQHGIAIGGQTSALAPADKKLYALRDVTATVDNLSLIASSIMSKKIAGGADAIVLDVKTGSGAFMKDLDSSFALAREMVDIGCNVGRETVAVVTDMDQPLGFAVGNILEVREAIETLRGNGPSDLTRLCMTLGSHMLVLGGLASKTDEARSVLEEIISSGKGLAKLKEFVKAQGGDPAPVDDPSFFPGARLINDLTAVTSGYVKRLRADLIGKASLILGAGRETKESTIDLMVGMVLHKKIGDHVTKNESLATVYANDEKRMKEALPIIREAFCIVPEKVEPDILIKGIVHKNSEERFQ